MNQLLKSTRNRTRLAGRLFGAFVLVAAVGLLAGATVTRAAGAPGQVIFDSTVSPLPGNLPSVGAEAYAFRELGDAVTFAGSARTLNSVTVTLSSWGCESGHWYSSNCATTPGATFSVPITLNIYAAGNPTPGALIASRTQTFAVPYRPSTDASNCSGGRWYDAAHATCFNGLANNITFDLSASGVSLPDAVVYGIVYNTSHFGPSPLGATTACYTSSGGCGYDSMNIALAPAVTVGSKPFPDTLYQNTSYAGNYCDSGATGTFRLDSPTAACWSGYIPAVQFRAIQVVTTADQCKKDGWQTLSRADGTNFKNQGDCVSYVNTAR